MKKAALKTTEWNRALIPSPDATCELIKRTGRRSLAVRGDLAEKTVNLSLLETPSTVKLLKLNQRELTVLYHRVFGRGWSRAGMQLRAREMLPIRALKMLVPGTINELRSIRA